MLTRFKLRTLLPFFAILFLPSIVCKAEKSAKNIQVDEFYQWGTQTRDGIGKYYMGREISQVMGHLGAGWLERLKREQEENRLTC